MAIELTTVFTKNVDEMFTAESKKAVLTNNDFDWTGAHSIKVWKITTANMNNYDRAGSGNTLSRYGAIQNLDATTEELTLKKDRSFIFAIDKLDSDETAGTLQAATALARQQREVVIPEVDAYTYGVMCSGAGTKATAKALTAADIYKDIIEANAVLDNNNVPETNRYLVVTPDTYLLMKQNNLIIMQTETGSEARSNGIIATLDGMNVVKVPANRLPAKFGFMLCHPSACVAPTKLEEFTVHESTPLMSGSIVTGRVCYDAFVLDNKKMAIYYQPTT